MTDPSGIDDTLRARLRSEFTDDQLIELTAAVTFASAFSKAAIAWGPPPEIPLMVVPTPTPTGDVNDVLR